jgi:hypothetical protein
MKLLDLPVEVFRLILEFTVHSSLQQAMHARVVCSKCYLNMNLSPTYKNLEIFNVELIQAICFTRILEEQPWVTRYITPGIVAEYLFKVSQSRDADRYQGTKLINQIVDYLIQKSCLSSLDRLECTRKICELTIKIAKRPLFCSVLFFDDYPSLFKDSATLYQIALVASIHCGFSAFTKTLINEGITNTGTRFGTSLRCALERNDNEIIAQLLLKEINGLYKGDQIEIAARNGNNLLVGLFLDLVRDTDSEPDHYLEAINGAAAGGQLDTIRFLERRARSHKRLLEKKNPSICWAGKYFTKNIMDVVIIAATYHGRSEIVQLALKGGADPFTRLPGRDKGPEAFVSACSEGHMDIVRMFLDQLSDKISDSIESIISQGLLAAIRRGWDRIVHTLLLREPLDGNSQVARQQLLCAAKFGQVNVVRVVLHERKTQLKNKPEVCEDAFSWAVSHGYTSIVRLMVEHDLIHTPV